MRRFVTSSRRSTRKSRCCPTVLYPIAYSTGGSSLSGTPTPYVTLVNENYRYPNVPTDTTYIYWDGPSDNGIPWKGFFGEITNGPANIDRIDVCVLGYGTKSAGPMNVYFYIRGKQYILGALSSLGKAWKNSTILGNWKFEDFNKPAASAEYTLGPFVYITLGGTSGNKDGYVYNVQIHLYGH